MSVDVSFLDDAELFRARALNATAELKAAHRSGMRDAIREPMPLVRRMQRGG